MNVSRTTEPWSGEMRALVRPASTFAALANGPHRPWAVARRPLLFLVVIACTVSLVASGRLSLRLISDGAISFAFIPAFEIAALALVVRMSSARRVALPEAVDLFFVGNGPWLLWLVVLAGTASIIPPTAIGGWSRPVILAMSIPLGWSAYIDWHFFREVMGRSRRAALGDLVLQRALGWGGTIVYFVGYSKLAQRLEEALQDIPL
jgi:hypothetical protein